RRPVFRRASSAPSSTPSTPFLQVGTAESPNEAPPAAVVFDVPGPCRPRGALPMYWVQHHEGSEPGPHDKSKPGVTRGRKVMDLLPTGGGRQTAKGGPVEAPQGSP